MPPSDWDEKVIWRELFLKMDEEWKYYNGLWKLETGTAVLVCVQVPVSVPNIAKPTRKCASHWNGREIPLLHSFAVTTLSELCSLFHKAHILELAFLIEEKVEKGMYWSFLARRRSDLFHRKYTVPDGFSDAFEVLPKVLDALVFGNCFLWSSCRRYLTTWCLCFQGAIS